MAQISITKTLHIELTPRDLAGLFAEMKAEEQAEFFNGLYIETTFWESPFVMQLQAVTDCENLTDEARMIMREVGQYSARKEAAREAYEKKKPTVQHNTGFIPSPADISYMDNDGDISYPETLSRQQ